MEGSLTSRNGHISFKLTNTRHSSCSSESKIYKKKNLKKTIRLNVDQNIATILYIPSIIPSRRMSILRTFTNSS